MGRTNHDCVGDDLLDTLTPEMKHVVSLIGIQAFSRLVNQHGGTRIYVPEAPPPTSSLAKLIGHEAAIRLGRYAGKAWFDVPRLVKLRRQHRNQKILEFVDAGWSTPKIARYFSLTERSVFRILRVLRRSDEAI